MAAAAMTAPQSPTPVPGAVTHTNATIAARITPVGVRPANAVKNTSAAQSPLCPPVCSPALPGRRTAAATQGRQP